MEINIKGNWEQTLRWLKQMTNIQTKFDAALEKAGREGVRALEAATPKNTDIPLKLAVSGVVTSWFVLSSNTAKSLSLELELEFELELELLLFVLFFLFDGSTVLTPDDKLLFLLTFLLDAFAIL